MRITDITDHAEALKGLEQIVHKMDLTNVEGLKNEERSAQNMSLAVAEEAENNAEEEDLDDDDTHIRFVSLFNFLGHFFTIAVRLLIILPHPSFYLAENYSNTTECLTSNPRLSQAKT